MKNRLFRNRLSALALCAAVALSMAGCGSSKGADAASAAESSQEAAGTAADEAAESTISEEDASQAASVVSAAPEAADSTEAAAEEDAGVSPEEQQSEDLSAGDAYYDEQYAYCNVTYMDGGITFVYPNGMVDDSTEIYNGKTLGGLCDYIDSEVLEEGRTINREFLYDLVSVQLIDPQMISDYEQFNMIMIYCLSMANEFHSMDIELRDLILTENEPAKHTFEVVAEGQENFWVLDGHEKKFYFNDGETEYISTMLDPETLAVWSLVVDQYFGETA